MICVYHSSDFDGVCSAAIALKRWPKIKLIGVSHEDDQNYKFTEIINSSTGFSDEVLYVLDYAFPPNIMEDLSKRFSMTWIDHHKTSINTMSTVEGFKPFTQITVLNTQSGCELTWDNLFPDDEPPLAVRHLGRYDIWDHSDPDTVPFQFGMKGIVGSMDPRSELWEHLLDLDAEDEEICGDNNIFRTGEAIVQYQRLSDAELFKRIMFKTVIVFDGSTRQVLAANRLGANSGAFEPYMDADYSIGCLFGMMADGKWKIGLYGGPHNSVDLGLVAKSLAPGGGGHPNAAGCVVDKLPDWLIRGGLALTV